MRIPLASAEITAAAGACLKPDRDHPHHPEGPQVTRGRGGAAGPAGKRKRPRAQSKKRQPQQAPALSEPYTEIINGDPIEAQRSGFDGEKEEQRSTVEETAAAKSDCRF